MAASHLIFKTCVAALGINRRSDLPTRATCSGSIVAGRFWDKPVIARDMPGGSFCQKETSPIDAVNSPEGD